MEALWAKEKDEAPCERGDQKILRVWKLTWKTTAALLYEASGFEALGVIRPHKPLGLGAICPLLSLSVALLRAGGKASLRGHICMSMLLHKGRL